MVSNNYKHLVWWLFVCLAVLVSCRQSPTPNPSQIDQHLVNVTVPAFANQPILLAVEDLLRDPESYSGKIVQVSGQFYREPTIICNEPFRPSPARWQLVNGQQLIAAGGSKSQLTSLAPEGLTIIVEGRWQFWRGAVGCGKESQIKELWYLDISHIIAPNPITMATLTPGDPPVVLPVTTPFTSTIIAQVPTIIVTDTTTTNNNPSPTLAFVTPEQQATTPVPIPPAVPATNTPTPIVISTNTLVPTAVIEEPTPTPRFSPTPSTTSPPQEEEDKATATPAGGEEPTAEPTDSVDPTAIPPTPSPEPTERVEGTATPIVAATPEEGEGDYINKGVLASQDLVIEELAATAIDQWTFQVESSTFLTVNVASDLETDIVVTIMNQEGTVLLTQNNAFLGEPEIVTGFPLTEAGNYFIRISESSGNAGTYSMILQDSDSYAFIFVGTMRYGDTRTESMSAQSDHFWHFSAVAGNSVTIRVMPNDSSDVFIEVYDTDASKIDAVDVGGDGVPETLDFTTPTNGFYAIRVGEYNFEPSNYTITLILN